MKEKMNNYSRIFAIESKNKKIKCEESKIKKKFLLFFLHPWKEDDCYVVEFKLK